MAIECLGLSHSYAEQLPGSYALAQPRVVPTPELVFFNWPLAQSLGLDLAETSAADLAACFSGSCLPNDARPLAQAYAGHQFGHFSPQLGDGRAHLLGELVTAQGLRFDLALKGSGRTPYSRGGDGLAALGAMLREVLISEAMAHLGIASTRSLAVVATGETLYRQVAEPGAVLARTAASHLRIGTLQYFASRGQEAELVALVNYSLARHYPERLGEAKPALALLEAVCQQQAQLLAQWMKVGFIHGVMNTDNMTLSGETIDYGPCAFLEAYSPQAVFSSIDEQGRYAYGNQPQMAQWNLARMAEALLSLIDPDPQQAVALASKVVAQFWPDYQQQWRLAMGQKLGLPHASQHDEPLILDWLELLAAQQVDFSLAFRRLAGVLRQQPEPLQSLFAQPQPLQAWLERWQQRLAQAQDKPSQIAEQMDSHNPLVIARNHQVEHALDEARAGRWQSFERLLKALRQPFVDHPDSHDLSLPASQAFTRGYRTFCGT